MSGADPASPLAARRAIPEGMALPSSGMRAGFAVLDGWEHRPPWRNVPRTSPDRPRNTDRRRRHERWGVNNGPRRPLGKRRRRGVSRRVRQTAMAVPHSAASRMRHEFMRCSGTQNMPSGAMGGGWWCLRRCDASRLIACQCSSRAAAPSYRAHATKATAPSTSHGGRPREPLGATASRPALTTSHGVGAAHEKGGLRNTTSVTSPGQPSTAGGCAWW